MITFGGEALPGVVSPNPSGLASPLLGFRFRAVTVSLLNEINIL
jgi:hypothetical protein